MMGKKKIEIKKIHDRKKRSVTFTERRQGLFKKADELCRLTGADISLIVFSPNGKPYTFGCLIQMKSLTDFLCKKKKRKMMRRGGIDQKMVMGFGGMI
ncbi:hypothetical protein MKX01_021710 [Papaver californicum]|nr:hypothetical protein MKX01_021710 [Papaver californicum]